MPIVDRPCFHCGESISPFSPSTDRKFCNQDCAIAARSAPTVPEGMKWCSRCKEVKPASITVFHRRARSGDGLHGWCKSCMNSRSRPKQWHQSPRGKQMLKSSRLRLRYGISADDYEKMFMQQEGRCASCNTQSQRLVVDHCHTTGLVRGLLCVTCNLLAGHLESGRMDSVVTYLKRQAA